MKKITKRPGPKLDVGRRPSGLRKKASGDVCRTPLGEFPAAVGASRVEHQCTVSFSSSWRATLPYPIMRACHVSYRDALWPRRLSLLRACTRPAVSPLEGQALALAPVTSRCSPGHAALHCTALLVWPNVVEMENSSHQYCNRALTRSTRFVHLP
jgi:hypothetical protein